MIIAGLQVLIKSAFSARFRNCCCALKRIPNKTQMTVVQYSAESLHFQKKKPPDRTILAFVDFSKAFDSVWHSALFHELLLLKLPPCFILWVRSFLSDPRAKVQVDGSRSLFFRIRRGVPQGSVLNPVLFILFVDDITKDLPRGAHASLYADDLAIWSSSPDPLKASSFVSHCPRNMVQRMETSS